jgi:hypothetical protein
MPGIGQQRQRASDQPFRNFRAHEAAGQQRRDAERARRCARAVGMSVMVVVMMSDDASLSARGGPVNGVQSLV